MLRPIILKSDFSVGNMKKFLGLVLILFASIATLAQERVIEKEEFYNVYTRALSMRGGKSSRTTIIWEFQSEGSRAFNFPSKLISEYVPNVGSRNIYEANPKTGSLGIERISIGKKVYERKGNGEWKEAALVDAPYTPKGSIKILNKEDEYKFLGSERLDNQNMTVYSWTVRQKYTWEKTNEEVLSNITTKYWFKENGELLKTEQLQESRTNGKVTSMKRTDIYEIDPNIKIEAPKLAPNK